MLKKQVDAHINEIGKEQYSTIIQQLDKEYKEAVSQNMAVYRSWSIDDMFKFSSSTFGSTDAIYGKIEKELRKRGYDGMIDQSGISSTTTAIQGVAPLILFNRESILQPVSTNMVSRRNRLKAYKDYSKWFKKQNGVSID